MASKDSRITSYISKSADFAQPILEKLRSLVHKACPEVEETMKWSFPHFNYKGEMMCSMAGFKQHCAFSFWKAALMKDPALLQNAHSELAMGHFGRICSIKDLPADKIIIAYIKEAMQLNDTGLKISKPKPTVKKDLEIPDYFGKAVKRNKAAWRVFENFSYSNKKEYLEWITDAKTEETRNKRLTAAIEWMAEGKARNWKYEK
jgi:uncharacterized protein YdeI (YjbR/CyaY-like superfamily)